MCTIQGEELNFNTSVQPLGVTADHCMYSSSCLKAVLECCRSVLHLKEAFEHFTGCRSRFCRPCFLLSLPLNATPQVLLRVFKEIPKQCV